MIDIPPRPDLDIYFHVHPQGGHEHDRGFETHRHARNGKTYFKLEIRSDGEIVKCEGHWSVEMGITDEWCYAKEGAA